MMLSSVYPKYQLKNSPNFCGASKKGVLKEYASLGYSEDNLAYDLSELSKVYSNKLVFYLGAEPSKSQKETIAKIFPSNIDDFARWHSGSKMYSNFRKQTRANIKKQDYQYDIKDYLGNALNDIKEMDREEIEDFKENLKMFFDEGDPMQYIDFLQEMQDEFLRFFKSANQDDIRFIINVFVPDEASGNKNALLNFINIFSSARIIQEQVAKEKIAQKEQLKNKKIENLHNFSYKKANCKVKNKRSENENFRNYLSSDSNLYAIGISKENADKILNLLAQNKVEQAQKILINCGVKNVDEKYLNDLYQAFLKDSKLCSYTPSPTFLDRKEVYCCDLNYRPRHMSIKDMTDKRNIQDLLESGFLIDEALRFTDFKKDEVLSPLRRHQLEEKIAKLYKDNLDFQNQFNSLIENNLNLQNQIRKIYGLYDALNNSLKSYANSTELDDNRLELSKHCILRTISRNLINPKHKELGYVDFNSLLSALQSGLLKSDGQDFTIKELGGFSGLRAIVNNGQIITLY